MHVTRGDAENNRTTSLQDMREQMAMCADAEVRQRARGDAKWVSLEDPKLGVSLNGGTPKSSIFIGFSIINHPFWGTFFFGNTQLIGKKNLIGLMISGGVVRWINYIYIVYPWILGILDTLMWEFLIKNNR